VSAEAVRSRNLRQLMLRAARTLNALLTDELAKRGYAKIRPAHSALLANLDLDGSSITVIAERANMTKQAMGLLVAELETMGYVTRKRDESDKRAHVICLTKSGHRLMDDTMRIVQDIERYYTDILGEQTMSGLRTGLAAFIGVRPVG
jgi:DNA-binding MarR family transcriptional regulator